MHCIFELLGRSAIPLPAHDPEPATHLPVLTSSAILLELLGRSAILLNAPTWRTPFVIKWEKQNEATK